MAIPSEARRLRHLIRLSSPLLGALLCAQDPAGTPAPGPADAERTTFRAMAKVHPARELRVRARADAAVAKLPVQVGDTVQQLDVVCELVAPELRAELRAREARAAAAEQRVLLLDARREQAALLLRQAERRAAATADSIALVAQQLEAQQQLTRTREQLYEAGRATQSDVQDCRRQLRHLELEHRAAELQQAQASDDVARQRLDVRQAELALEEHRILSQALVAERDGVRALVEQLNLRSPLEQATVSQVLVGPGDAVEAGDELLVLTDARSVRVEVWLELADAARVRPGAAVRLLDIQGETELGRGRIARCSGAAVRQDYAAAWVDLDNADRRWVPGRALVVEVEPAP